MSDHSRLPREDGLMDKPREPYLKWIEREFGSVENHVRRMYGESALFDIVDDNFAIIHLDDPDEATRGKRLEEFKAQRHDGPPDDCPLCQMTWNQGGFWVFDNYDEELTEEEIAEFDEWEKEIEAKRERGEEPLAGMGPWSFSGVNLDNIEVMEPGEAMPLLIFALVGPLREFEGDMDKYDVDPELSWAILGGLRGIAEEVQFLVSDQIAPAPISVTFQKIDELQKSLGKLSVKELKDKRDHVIALLTLLKGKLETLNS